MTSYDTPIRDALAAQYDEFTVEREVHAVPPHATFEVVVGGRRAICKLARGPEADPATEARILQHVRRETTIPVPKVLAVGDDYFVAAWSEDVPSSGARRGSSDSESDGVPQNVEPPAGEAWARVAGEAMASLHEQAGFDAFGFPRAADGGVADGRLVVDARESWHATVCDYLADLRDWLAPHGYDDVAAELLGFLREHPDAFRGCGSPVLCHGNFGPDHVGVRDGEVAHVIDFEHALVAPAEYDYWRTVVPVFLGPSGPESDAPREAFRAGYESVRALPPGFDRRGRLYRALYSVWALQSLFLQRNVTGDEATEFADWLREHVAETVADLRAEFE